MGLHYSNIQYYEKVGKVSNIDKTGKTYDN